MPLGIYISVPFCRTKCSFCNFASGVFSQQLFERYVDHVCREIGTSEGLAREMGGRWEREIDSIYLGGGTPSVLAPDQLERLFAAVRGKFDVSGDAEITVECAPGTLSPELLDVLVRCGVNRVSLGVQSFVDRETRAVGRLHTREITLADIARLREAGISNLSIDLIAGLPHQTDQSWRYSLEETVATGVPHVSVYMLEVDQDSRLGRELIAGGTRYHAHFVPDEDSTANFYEQACEFLDEAGVRQYEISNFARPEQESKHNLKYWLRQPYLGFGVDAHSMLWGADPEASHGIEAVRFATPDDLDALLGNAQHTRTEVDRTAAEDEAFFLGLRLCRGVNLEEIASRFGEDAVRRRRAALDELVAMGLIEQRETNIRLTRRGRLLSNEVFERLMRAPVANSSSSD